MNVETKKQRSRKLPLYLNEKREELLNQLKAADIIQVMGEHDEMVSLFVKTIIPMPKSDFMKLVKEARFLNSVTDQTNYSWLLEPVQRTMTRLTGKFSSVSDLSCTYHQVPLKPETRKLNSFIIGGRQYTYTRGLYGLCRLPSLFSGNMTIYFGPLIKKRQANNYIGDTIMLFQSKGELFSIIDEYQE